MNTRVETLSQSLETTQQMTRENAQRITRSTRRPIRPASGPRTHRPLPPPQAATQPPPRRTPWRASKRLVYEVVISEDQGDFKFGSAELPEASRRASTR